MFYPINEDNDFTAFQNESLDEVSIKSISIGLSDLKEEEPRYTIIEKPYIQNKEDEKEQEKKSTRETEEKNSMKDEEEFNDNKDNNNFIIFLTHHKQSNHKDKKTKNNESNNKEKFPQKEEKKNEADNCNNVNNGINIELNIANKNNNIPSIERPLIENGINIQNNNLNNNENINIIPPNNESEISSIENITKANTKTKNKTKDKNIYKLIKKKIKNNSFDYIGKMLRKELLSIAIKFINNKIRIIYKNDMSKFKQFINIDKSKFSHSNVDFDKNFIHYKMSEILSCAVSKKITNYLPNHNKDLVEELINSDQTDYFKKIFDLKFFNYLEHFRGSKFYDLLDGMETIDIFLENYEKNEHKDLIKIINIFEKILDNRKARKPRNKNKKD